MNSVLSSLIFNAFLPIHFDTSVMQSWIRVIASCTAVVLFAHCIYILGVISITVIVDAVFIDDISQWCHIDCVQSGS